MSAYRMTVDYVLDKVAHYLKERAYSKLYVYNHQGWKLVRLVRVGINFVLVG